MALEALHDSKYQFGFSSRVLNQVTGHNMQPSSSDNLLPKGGQYQAVVASLLNASSVNLPGSAATIALMNEGIDMGMISGITNPAIVHETANFKLSRFNSLVPDGNSAVSTGPQSHRSANANVYSYLSLPPLPVFSSHSFNSSVSSITEGSFTMQQTSRLGLNGSQARKRKQRGLTTTSLPDLQRRQNLALSGLNLDLCTSSDLHKKPRLDMLQIMSKNENQLNVLPSTPQIRGVDIEKLQQMRQHQLQQVVHQAPAAYALHSGECSHRIMQYIHHLRHRPSDNDIAYWRKFVAEYYAPCAKKRWCLSLYDNVGHHALGVFPKATMDAWQCDLCGSKSGRGFEANLETLPRLNKIMFESGVIDELLYLDLPYELVLYSGLMMLEYGKAVQEIVYEQFRVVREGKLRIIFTPDLKILSWEFCSWRNEEFLPRNLVAPQVNQLVQTAQKYQSASESDGASPHDLQENCNMFLVAGCQLARNMELQLVDNFGFPKRYVRCLQIAEIVSSMNDLITFSLNNNCGPIESLKNYSQGTSSSKTLKHESQEEGSAQGLLNDGTKLMASLPVLDNGKNDSSNFTGSGPLAGSEEAMPSLGYYERLLKQNSFTQETSKGILEPYSYNGSSASSKSFQGRKTLKSGLVQNFSVDSLSSFNSSECNQKTEECLIQKLLQEMINNSRTASGRGCSASGVEKVNRKTTNSKVAGLPAVTRVGREIDVNSTAALKASGNPVNNSVARKFSSFTVAAASAQPSSYGNDNFIRKEQYLPEFIQNMLGGCFDKSISDGGGCDINYHRKA